jgi:hypothetical protein
VGAALIYADGWTDREDEANHGFSLFMPQRLKTINDQTKAFYSSGIRKHVGRWKMH